MRLTRYRLMISSTANEFLVSVQQIMAKDQAQAEGRATNLLRARRLISPEGKAWDRWDLGAKARGEHDWTHVARGNANGTTEGTRHPPAWERRRGQD